MVDAFWTEKCPSLKHVEFEVFSDKQLDFLKSLCDSEHDENASELFRGICGQDDKTKDCCLSGLTFKFYKAAHWIALELDINSNRHRSHLTIGDNISDWGNIWEGVTRLEEWYQLKEGLAVWKDDIEEVLPESEDNSDDDEYSDPVLIPVTVELLESIPQPERRTFIEKLDKETFFDLHWKQILGIELEQFQKLKYGESGFRLDVMLKAEKGNPDAVKAWDAIK